MELFPWQWTVEEEGGGVVQGVVHEHPVLAAAAFLAVAATVLVVGARAAWRSAQRDLDADAIRVPVVMDVAPAPDAHA